MRCLVTLVPRTPRLGCQDVRMLATGETVLAMAHTVRSSGWEDHSACGTRYKALGGPISAEMRCSSASVVHAGEAGHANSGKRAPFPAWGEIQKVRSADWNCLF